MPSSVATGAEQQGNLYRHVGIVKGQVGIVNVQWLSVPWEMWLPFLGVL